MLLRTISISTENVRFSLRTGNIFIPMRAVFAYELTSSTVKYYKRNHWNDLDLDAIELSRDIYRRHSRNNDPLYYFRKEEGVMSLFLPENDPCFRAEPFGFNWLEFQHHRGQDYIEIAMIENRFTDTYKGIGKATIAQTCAFHAQLLPDAKEDTIALKIEPRKNYMHLREIYIRYGFSPDPDSKMSLIMTTAGARMFLKEYYGHLRTYFPSAGI
jgi:hypothetical protein